MDYCFWCSSYFSWGSVRCLCVHGVHHTKPRRNLQELCRMRNTDKLLLEIIDDVLRRLPKKPNIEPYELWNSIPNLRRARRVDAYCLEERRGHRSRRSSEWLDTQKSSNKQTKD